MCENCGKEITQKIGSGRFCSLLCARSFSTREKRKEINEKVRTKLLKNKVVDKICPVCNSSFSKSWSKRHTKTCNKFCGAKLANSSPGVKEKIRKARIKSINDGNIGFGIKCSYNGIRCDSALEYAFLKWYFLKYPEAKIVRYAGSLSKDDVVYIPDFLIDDSILVEVKYETAYVGKKLQTKWASYVNSQDKKREILSESGYRFIWFTNKDCGNAFYKKCIREIKALHCANHPQV